ncbi:T9SS type B sorting domain-containing protein [Tamlana sp. 2_MG-2023]|uniref:T9SS type B sorting domain-containing protein n=1 Tax=unclassified Tamlana TaxID=2614803 RepID=UPI0026E3BBC9|nr:MULTISPECIES: T9SS type B sorting domain-containing protein [unclassified Tamlana]MDO6761465.1 T9SS type B sorting domain-containing protein [Tamlana sp. 2_MG-2023]MDO6792360.1 T9SS type B sorting domain-containing protein [Tamlana sp. 1_MG-2023]
MIKFNLKKMFLYVFFLLIPVCIWSQDVKVELTFTYQNTPAKIFTVNDLIVIDLPTAATATWYDAPSGGNLLLLNEPLVSGQIYYLETIPAANIGTRLQTIVYEISPSLEADKPNDVCMGEQVTITAKDLLTNEQFEVENTNGIGLGLTKITDYGDSSYFVKEDKMSWEDAYTLINAIPGAAMYIINDTSEESFVFNALTNLGLADPGDANAFWLGLKQFASAVDFDDTVNQTGWYWIDGTPMGYRNWSNNEPNDYRDAPGLTPPYQLYEVGGINDEDYAQFDFQARGMQWNDAPNDTANRNSFPIFEFTGISGLQWYQLNTTTNAYEAIPGATNGDLQIIAAELSQKYRLEFSVNSQNLSLDYEVKAVDVQISPIASTLTTACDDEVDPLLQDGVYAFDTSTFESTLLNGQMGMTISYTDENGLPLPSPLPNPFVTGTQQVNVRIESNSTHLCFSTGIIDFVVNGLPNIRTNTDGSEDVTMCSGSTTTLDAGIADGSSETDYTYVWSKDGTVISPSETNQTLTVDTDGDYTVEVTSIASGCNVTRNINVVVTQDPQPVIKCWETATFNNSTCSWDVIGGKPSEPTNIECWEATTFDTSTCTWVVSGTKPIEPTGLECWETAEFDKSTCSWLVTGSKQIETLNFELCSNQALELYATTVVSNPSYKWSTGEVSDRIYVTTGGTYTVQISDGSCIVSEITYNVTPIAAPSIQSVVSDADKIIINTTTNGDFLYSLEGDIYQSSNIFYNIPAGLYTIHVKEAFCNDVDTREHFHFYIPKFFTPNHDGFNDTFEIKGLEFFGSSEVSIFNRYGKLLKHVINNSFSWDGRYNGTEQRTDDYWYVVIVDGKKITGHVTLKR